MKRFLFSFLCLCALCAFSKISTANEAMPLSVQNEMKELKDMVAALQSAVQDLKSTVQNQNEVIQQQVVRINGLEQGQDAGAGFKPARTVAETGGREVKGRSQGFNPDIGVVGTVQAKLTELSEDGEGNDTIALKEIELNFAQYVDPYSRLDAVISFNDALEAQNAEIEEAYYSHWGLPWGFYGQLGKFRSKIGKQNLLHLDQLPTADFPLVIQDFFGEEGLASSGVRLQNMIPNPWDIPIEITGEALRGNNGNSFSGVSRRPIFNTHAKTFFETSENTNLELGWTTMFGDENPPQFSGFNANGDPVTVRSADGRDKYGVKVYGADATWNWLLPEGKSFKFQNEVYFQRRGTLARANEDPWGFYSLLDYRFSPKFSAGLRFDYVELLAKGLHGKTTGISPYLTFWQSEFANFRVQYSHTEPAAAEGISDDAVYLQANVLIGSHQHPVQ